MKLDSKKANKLLKSQGTSLVIPAGYTRIEDDVFRDSGITEVVLPEGLKSIGDYAFSWCNLKKITFPSSLEWIGANAFRSNKLSKIDFGNGIEQIDELAFADNKLKTLRTPSHTLWASSSFSANPLKKVFYEAGSPSSSAVAQMDHGGAKLVAQKIKSIKSIMDIRYKNGIQTYKLEENHQIAYASFEKLIAGSNNSDEIIGSSANEIIAGGKGKNVLQGIGGKDGYLFDETTDYGKSNVDTITDFVARRRKGGTGTTENLIYLSEQHFNLRDRCKNVSFRFCQGVKILTSSGDGELKTLAKKDTSFVYDKIKGYLFYNENGSEEGWGDGGAFVKLLGSPNLTGYDFRTF